ncbi:MAG: ATP synthase F1 subunit gamma [Alphaproteobacteria bacterium]|nr:ATP synthase F1 subunit gamma [Alphaproteobacteria bacterium]
MSNLKTLRNRIKSVKSTQKITKAMRMVAVSKLNKAKISTKYSSSYREKITQLLYEVKKSGEIEEEGLIIKTLFKDKEENCKSAILIIYGSDRGLCGPYNTNILKKFKEELGKYNNPKVVCVGKKLSTLLAKIITPALTFNASTDPILLSNQIKEFILEEVEKEPSCMIVSFFTKFLNTITLVPTSLTLAPIETFETKSLDVSIDFEGGNLKEALAHKYFEANIVANLYGSLASSHASSMTAMDNASKNAGEMIQKLTLQQNRTRQSIITNELIEVIAGAGAV